MKDELAIARVKKAEDNRDITPIDLMKMAINDLQTGEVTATKCLLLLINAPTGEGWDIEVYRANINRMEEVAVMAVRQHRQIENWMEDPT